MLWVPQNVFSWRNKKIVNTFWLIKNALSGALIGKALFVLTALASRGSLCSGTFGVDNVKSGLCI